jgi:predicted TIM-barrel fold metal-dependent hydrolase
LRAGYEREKYTMRYLLLLVAIAVLPLTALGQTARSKTPHNAHSQDRAARQAVIPQSNRSTQITPLVDHHQHLLSPAGAEAKLPTIQLPEALGSLVRDRELGWNNSTALAKLFVEDGVLFTGWRWISGHKAIAGYLAGGYTGPYRLKPVSYRIDGSAGQIAGYMVEDDGTNVHFAFFHLILSKDSDGPWRIKSETQIFPGPAIDKPVTAEQLIKGLDEVGIRRAVVLSDAYYFGAGSPKPVPDEYNKVRAENDWTAQQVSQFSDRLVAFCSFNPLRDYALAELDRCASSGRFKGLKLHFNAAQLDFQNPEQVSKVRRVMELANKYRLPMIIHIRPGDVYGRREAEVFLHQLVAAAPDVPIQIAHLWGGESFSGSALAVYADAVATGDPVTRNVYFDISGAWSYGKPEEIPEIVARIRQIGLKRILYASDAPPPEAWEAFRKKLPLTDMEFRVIANNIAPYMRDQQRGNRRRGVNKRQ